MAGRKRTKDRADTLAFASGLTESVREAGALIMTGKLMATDQRGKERKVKTAGEALHIASTFRIAGRKLAFVSRGGLKLQGALDALGVDPRDKACADIGISTGGFTDCLLQRGAAHVHGVDVSYGLTAWKIRTDPRVTLHERTNARHLTPETFGGPVDLLVADLSFIGLSRLLPTFAALVASGGSIVALVKPQFELPPDRVGAGGIVRDEQARKDALDGVLDEAARLGIHVKGHVDSPVAGADGNREILVWLKCP